MRLYNTFIGGAMNKDLELRIFPKNIYLDAKNVRIASAGDQNSRSVKLPLGNTQLSNLVYSGSNPTCIGEVIDTSRNLIYYVVATSTHSYVVEYNIGTDSERFIMNDVNSSGVLLWTPTTYVDMAIINDNDNGRNYLVLTDNTNEPKYFEIELVAAIAANSYDDSDVNLIKSFPVQEPRITLSATVTNEENNIESKFLSFAFRYKYQNGEWSALSTFSEFAFLPDAFSYNYKEGTNNSMFNDFSQATIAINTGNSNVSDVQLIVKESGSNVPYIVDTYNKADEGWNDSQSEDVTFDNSRIYKALAASQLSRLYDNVPTRAASVAVAGNRIHLGNYTEGYNLEYLGSPIDTVFSLGYTSSTGTLGSPHKQVKTNRDYEVAIYYMDGKGRKTTPLVSSGNTTFVPYSVADQQNKLQVTIDKNTRPPDWATRYGFCIKQSKVDYDVIAPIIFYREGVFAWIKLEGNDVQKVGEGDFIYVKSDTSGLKSTTIRTKVLEIKSQDVNFLENEEPVPFAILQESGTYMRLQVDDFALSPEAVTVYEWIGYSFRSDGGGGENNILGSLTYVEPIYYDGSDLNDLTQGGALIGDNDIRFEVEIDGTAPDTFRWRSWNVSDDDAAGAWTSGVTIIGSSTAQPLSDGITISFVSSTGHTIGDKWFISCKSIGRTGDWNRGGSVSSAGRHAIVLLKAEQEGSTDATIKAGSQITITYDDTGSDTGNVEDLVGFLSFNLTSSKDYPNIEEWFYGDNIMNSLTGLVWEDDINNVMFRRGTLVKTDGQQMTVTGLATDTVFMAFLSVPRYTGSSSDRIRIDNSYQTSSFENNIIFETLPPDITTEIFYELPYTYFCTSGIHLGSTGDITQSFGVTDGVINLPYFNSFGWYNGFESYKIADTFNENTMVLDTKPIVPVDEYKEVTRIASITYSGRYEGTTQTNLLNEFNLSLVNYKDLEINYGDIRKMHPNDTDIVVFQNDKTSKVLLDKSMLYNADGTGNLTQSLNVLGQQIAYTGEYGIGNNPESFAFFGNRIYHIDKERGAMMRLSVDGYTEISQQGMSDYFRTLPDQTTFVGGFDPYNDEYLLNIAPDGSPLTIAFQEGVGFGSFYEFQPERLIGIDNRLYSIKDGQIWLHDDNLTRNSFYGVQRTASITTLFNDEPQDVKHFKSVNLESTNEWSAVLTSNFASGTILPTEFVLEEGEYYAYIRQNEKAGIDNQAFGSSIGGIGQISSIASLTLTMNVTELTRAMSIGDVIWKDNGDDTVTVSGTITAIDRINNTITLDSVAGLIANDFIMFAKNERVEGAAFKGYYLQIELSNASNSDEELFAVKVEAARSSD